MAQYNYLRTFSADELYLDEDETRIILKFFFPNDEALIDGLVINDKARAFAQGLLVEAIDASYSLGFVQILSRIIGNPTKSPIKIIQSFTRKAAKHWFKHAKGCDLVNVRIYDRVRDQISIKFRNHLQIELSKSDTPDSHPLGAFLAYSRPQRGDKVWG